MKSCNPCGPSDAKEKEWQAESDASTLTRVQEIKRDPARYKRAKAKLKKVADDALLAAAEEGVRVKFRNLRKQ